MGGGKTEMKTTDFTADELRLIITCIDAEWLRCEEHGYKKRLPALEALNLKTSALLKEAKEDEK